MSDRIFHFAIAADDARNSGINIGASVPIDNPTLGTPAPLMSTNRLDVEKDIPVPAAATRVDSPVNPESAFQIGQMGKAAQSEFTEAGEAYADELFNRRTRVQGGSLTETQLLREKNIRENNLAKIRNPEKTRAFSSMGLFGEVARRITTNEGRQKYDAVLSQYGKLAVPLDESVTKIQSLGIRKRGETDFRTIGPFNRR